MPSGIAKSSSYCRPMPGSVLAPCLENFPRRYPGQWNNSVLRTLQRRIRLRRAKYEVDRKIYFTQKHPLGRQSISDFTVADELNVELAGTVFTCRLYQFALAYSGWRYVTVIDSGESFLALSTSLQAALWALRGVAEEHCTDSL